MNTTQTTPEAPTWLHVQATYDDCSVCGRQLRKSEEAVGVCAECAGDGK